MNKYVLFLFNVTVNSIIGEVRKPYQRDKYVPVFLTVRHSTLISIVLLVVGLFGCTSLDPEQQQKRELQRDALKLRMGQALNPTDAEGYIQLGNVYRELGEYEKAIESFQNAIVLDDNHPHAYNNLGLVYTDTRLFALAIEMFLAALELSPGNPAFYNNLGYAYDMTDQFEAARAAFQNAIESDPTFVDAYYNLASAYLQRDMYQDAIQHYETALEMEAGDADAYFNLGPCLRRERGIPECYPVLRKRFVP